MLDDGQHGGRQLGYMARAHAAHHGAERPWWQAKLSLSALVEQKSEALRVSGQGDKETGKETGRGGRKPLAGLRNHIHRTSSALGWCADPAATLLAGAGQPGCCCPGRQEVALLPGGSVPHTRGAVQPSQRPKQGRCQRPPPPPWTNTDPLFDDVPRATSSAMPALHPHNPCLLHRQRCATSVQAGRPGAQPLAIKEGNTCRPSSSSCPQHSTARPDCKLPGHPCINTAGSAPAARSGATCSAELWRGGAIEKHCN